MSRKSITTLSKQGIALTIISKLLYGVGDKSPHAEELSTLYQSLLRLSGLSDETCDASVDSSDPFSLSEIPWENILDSITADSLAMRKFVESGKFTDKELQYMCALMCGLSGKEYELITGLRSQYNLSWSIRQKLGIPPKSTNLRNFLQNLSERAIV
ncbi:MAG: hypothetical protein HDS35_04215 [Bacteroides sp.]|nr:hypothetical protein [Bacteroides sp.]